MLTPKNMIKTIKNIFIVYQTIYKQYYNFENI